MGRFTEIAVMEQIKELYEDGELYNTRNLETVIDGVLNAPRGYFKENKTKVLAKVLCGFFERELNKRLNR